MVDIANAALTSMLKILSYLIINQTIGISVQINRSLQIKIPHQINIQNNQSLKLSADPPHKIWEWHFKLHRFSFTVRPDLSTQKLKQISNF